MLAWALALLLILTVVAFFIAAADVRGLETRIIKARENHKKGEKTKISVKLDPLLPAGEYYVCDPCHIEEITHDERMAGARRTWDEDGGWNGKAVAVRKGDRLIAWTVAGGNGEYTIDPDGWVTVDSGNIGVASTSVGAYNLPSFVSHKPFSLVRQNHSGVVVSAVTVDGKTLISARADGLSENDEQERLRCLFLFWYFFLR